MATSTIVTLIAAAVAMMFNGWPRKNSTPTTPTNPTPNTPTPTPNHSDDMFNGLPGLPGHPLLNAIFRRRAEENAVDSLVSLITTDPVTRAKIEARLGD